MLFAKVLTQVLATEEIITLTIKQSNYGEVRIITTVSTYTVHMINRWKTTVMFHSLAITALQ